jgi:hypothetical protein
MVPSLRFIISAATALLSHISIAEPVQRQHVSFKGPFEVEAAGIQNINIEYHGAPHGELTLSYGPCDMTSSSEAYHKVGSTHIGNHPMAKRHLDWADKRPTKFVWIAPTDISTGCLHAHMGDDMVGSSKRFSVKKRAMKKRGTFAQVTDPMGPWFDGVEYLQQKQPDETFVASTKEKKFGILGAGISGLLISVCEQISIIQDHN